jgi:hypothetical protein
MSERALELRACAHRMWRWRISTRAWCMDLARPSLNTCVCRRRSMKLSVDSVST